MKRERFASRVGLGVVVTEAGLEEDSTNTMSSLMLAPSTAKVKWRDHIHLAPPLNATMAAK